METIISPSILAADFNILGEQIQEVEKSGAKYLHIDVMDGIFVPSISFGMPVITSVRKHTKLFFDVHLMIIEPIRYVEEFVKAGADMITFHLEAAEGHVEETLDKIHALGCKAGLSVKPATPVSALEPYVMKTDMILVMTVEPRFGGQKYIETSTEKIRAVRQLLERHGLKTDIEVDGGITVDNAGIVKEAGANVLVAGSTVFQGNIAERVQKLLQA